MHDYPVGCAASAIDGPKKRDKLVRNESFTGGGSVSRKFLITFFEIAFAVSLPAVLVFGQSDHPAPTANPPARSAVKASAGDAATERAVIDKYCVTCHNTKVKTAN